MDGDVGKKVQQFRIILFCRNYAKLNHENRNFVWKPNTKYLSLQVRGSADLSNGNTITYTNKYLFRLYVMYVCTFTVYKR